MLCRRNIHLPVFQVMFLHTPAAQAENSTAYSSPNERDICMGGFSGKASGDVGVKQILGVVKRAHASGPIVVRRLFEDFLYRVFPADMHNRHPLSTGKNWR